MFRERIAMGQYINSKLNLCHNPSNAMTVPLQYGLSAIINSAKNTIARIKQIRDNTPKRPLDILKKYIPMSKGASVKRKKPITEP